ncbi:hypothetical protein ACFY5C_13440 [Streptomyces sp. NPDC012935]|uniref:hypothetical protein n=1 Tax=Streptomyces sp. NPDC012935 TaxID=3364857 RepID=UPI0036B79ABB
MGVDVQVSYMRKDRGKLGIDEFSTAHYTAHLARRVWHNNNLINVTHKTVPRPHLHWGSWSMAFVATLAEGTGIAFAPMLEEGMRCAVGCVICLPIRRGLDPTNPRVTRSAHPAVRTPRVGPEVVGAGGIRTGGWSV